MRDGERGQGTVEWVGLVCLVSLLLVGFLAAGVRVPGAALAQSIASRILCAAALADRCGDEPVLIAAYGTEVGELVRRHMPSLLFERGSKAVPVDFRRCRETSCGDGAEHGLVRRTDAGLPVSAFVHVVDCRADAMEGSEAEGADCTGARTGNLYIQYWTYYADSATFGASRSSALPDFIQTTGRGSRSAFVPTARSTSGLPRTRATTSARARSVAGPRTPALIQSRT